VAAELDPESMAAQEIKELYEAVSASLNVSIAAKRHAEV
jgi:hypothetical protein